MSLLSSTFIFLVLFFSMQTCNARNFKIADESSSGQHHIEAKSLKSVEEKTVKLKIDTNSVEGKEGIAEKSHFGTTPQKTHFMKSKGLHQDMTLKKGLIAGVASFSWHQSHKNGNENPGFYSDYSRPRTRPPSHN